MKRIHLALAAAGLSLSMSAFAMFDGTYVKVPASRDGWFVGLEALYLQPSDSNGDLAYATVTDAALRFSAITPTNVKIYSLEPDYNWGWRLFAGYNYGAANDITVSYMQLYTSDEDDVDVDPTGTLAVGSVGEQLAAFVSGENEGKYKIDQVDLTLGQKIDITGCVHMRLFGGLRYTRLHRSMHQSFVAANGVEDTLHYRSNFDGIGPIVGTDVWYAIGYGFNVVGSVDAAVLVGDINSKVNVGVFNAAGVQTSEIDISTDKTNRVPTVVDMRLGVNYVYDMGNDSALKFELGYQASSYHHIVDKPTFSEFTPIYTTSSVGLNGPYFNVVYNA